MTIGQRLPALAISICVVIGLAVALFVVTGAVGTDASKPVADRSSEAAAELTGALRVKATRVVAASFDPAAFSDMARRLATDAIPAIPAAAADPIVVASLAPLEVAPPSLAAPMGTDVETERAPAVEETPEAVALLDECFVLDTCVDHYLWELYQRTAKQDTNKAYEWRTVKVKKKRKMVTVKKRFVRLFEADFTWKDPDAAEKFGMSLMDYVIGGMDRDFKLKLFQTLRAAEKAGLSPGITSGFRDDYRQSIASGQKAASNRSYHGGSLRGGYGHGVAADVVSTKGATRARRWLSTVALWEWIDANERQTGIGRPYLGKDPPHVAAINGEEYVSRRGPKTQVAQAEKPKARETKAEDTKVKEAQAKQAQAKDAKAKDAKARDKKPAQVAKQNAKPAPKVKQAARPESAPRNAKPKAAPVRAKLASAKRS